jgi:purine-binding chemotaxis protein CheW
MQVVAFRCADISFGVPIHRVREIVTVPQITPVPECPAFVRGIINLRGRILPVLDLAQRLGLEAGPRDGSGRILIVEQDAQHLLGMLVDQASEVLRIPDDGLAPPPELAAHGAGGAVTSVARLEERLVLLLDLDRILTQETLPALVRPSL